MNPGAKGLAIGVVTAIAVGGAIWVSLGFLKPAAVDLETGTRGTSSDVDGTPSPASRADEYFEAFWPATSRAGAEELQASVDSGAEPWMKDPAEVAKAFLKQRFGWGGTVTIEDSETESRIDGIVVEQSGSKSDGWEATVRFRHRFVRGGQGGAGFLHELKLMGLKGEDKPAWFVVALMAEDMHVDAPAAHGVVTSPMKIAGKGSGYEATIDVLVEDDSGGSIGRGFTMGGAYEPQPFEGEIAYSGSSTLGGRILFTPSSGAEGPPPFATIVRVRFR